jgi:ABC-type dipeptide/oligopeptide/nickel transport system permease subunit
MTSTTVPPLPLEQLAQPQSRTPLQGVIRRIVRHRSAQVGSIILGLLILIAIFAPLIAPYSPIQILKNEKRRTPPCIHVLGCPSDQVQHIMGLDGNGRDLFSRVIYGSRLSLVIGLTTVSAAILIGASLGGFSGFVGGWLDNIIMRIMDVLLAFPSLLLAISIVSTRPPEEGYGLIYALMAISFVSIPVYARIMRASVLQVKEQDFVVASRALGANALILMLRHILPNALTPLIVQGTLGIATAILEAAALSFLGLGAEKPTPEWGLMLGEERNSVFTAPYLVFFPGIAIALTVLCFNLIGDGLRDALDPRLSNVS